MSHPAPKPSNVYIIRRNSQVVGYSDKGRLYLIGFVQQTHAHLVRRHITVSPVLRLDRPSAEEGNLWEDTDAMLSVLKVASPDTDGMEKPSGWEVAPIEYNKFIRIPLISDTGVLVSHEFLNQEEDDHSFSFRCQVVDTTAPRTPLP